MGERTITLKTLFRGPGRSWTYVWPPLHMLASLTNKNSWWANGNLLLRFLWHKVSRQLWGPIMWFSSSLVWRWSSDPRHYELNFNSYREALKIQGFNGVWTHDLQCWYNALTNWAMFKPRMVGAGHLQVQMFLWWLKWIIYHFIHSAYSMFERWKLTLNTPGCRTLKNVFSCSLNCYQANIINIWLV